GAVGDPRTRQAPGGGYRSINAPCRGGEGDGARGRRPKAPFSGGLQGVGLPEAHPAIDEQRVVVITRLVCHGLPGGVGELIRRADDKVRKRELRVERAVRDSRAALSAPTRVGEELSLSASLELDDHLTRAH